MGFDTKYMGGAIGPTRGGMALSDSGSGGGPGK